MAQAAESEGAGRAARGFVVTSYVIQFFFGGWFFFNGINYFAAFTPPPPGSSPLSRELITALENTGLFAVVKAVELVTGAALLANRFVPLAALLAFPVTFAIAYVMMVINGGTVGMIVGPLAVAFNGIIVLARLDSFLPVLAYRDRGPAGVTLTSLMKIGTDPVASYAQGAGPSPGLRPIVHLIAIVLGIGAPVAIELGTMAYFQSVAKNSMTEDEKAGAIR